jgi:hypothetical protein
MLRTKREARGWVTKPGARRRLLGTQISIASGGGITATVKSGRRLTPHSQRYPTANGHSPVRMKIMTKSDTIVVTLQKTCKTYSVR